MKQEDLREIFEELLNKYYESEKTIIYEFGPYKPGRTEADELGYYKKKSMNIKRSMKKHLKNNLYNSYF